MFDDISDTGGMTKLTATILRLANEAGYDFTLIASGATMSKSYTYAAEKIQEEFGIPLFSGLAISDLGMAPKPWMSINGIKDASFSFADN